MIVSSVYSAPCDRILGWWRACIEGRTLAVMCAFGILRLAEKKRRRIHAAPRSTVACYGLGHCRSSMITGLPAR